MKIGGTEWHDPATPGEGLDLFVYPDGQVIAKWYGYDARGQQQWLIAVGEADDDTGWLRASVTARSAAGSVVEREWGAIVVREVGDRLRVTLDPDDGNDGNVRNLTLVPLYVPAVQPEPGTEIVIRNGQGHETGVPCESATVKSGDKFSIEVVKGKLTITDIVSYGNFHPRLDGIQKGDVTSAGQFRVVAFRLDPGWEQVGGSWEPAGLTVHTKELGPIFNLAAQVRRI